MNWSGIGGSPQQGTQKTQTEPATQPGVMVNVPDQDSLLRKIEGHFKANEGFTIATLNLDHAVKLQNDSKFCQAYAQHTYVTADGNPVVWLSRLSGQQVQLVPGCELIEPMSALAHAHDVKVALFGATQASLDTAADGLTALFPNLKIVAALAPPMGFDPESAAANDYIKQLKASEAGLCFLALGAPKQEIFAIHAAQQMPSTGFISIGAGLDFISDQQIRAPIWIRRLAIEWLWRLLHNPKRLANRYASCFAILPNLIWASVKARRDAQKTAA